MMLHALGVLAGSRRAAAVKRSTDDNFKDQK